LGAALEAERERISFLAHGQGDKAARQRLTAIHSEISVHSSECASFDAAIVEAKKNLSAAEAAAQRAERRAAAERALELSRQMRESAQLAGEALTALTVRIEKFRTLAREARAAGFGASDDQIRINLARALESGALRAILGGPLALVPQRVEAGVLLATYAARTEAAARVALAEGNEEAA
jgi:hypothetical protein